MQRASVRGSGLFLGLKGGAVLLRTKVFELYSGYYGNLSQLANAMGISKSQVSRVRSGKRNINQQFIIGALSAFPQCSFNELFYLAQEGDGSVTEERSKQVSRSSMTVTL